MEEKITGGEALMRCLECEGVDLIFGYPGGTIMPVYDRLFDYPDKLKHVLTRHEQGAVHAAQGYARATGKPGVVMVTSGPGATNLVTGIADARMDSTPLVVIAGQVSCAVLGNDAFQETDLIDITNPISKYGIQVRSAQELPEIISKAFFIAKTGRPGPVVVDLPRNVQVELMDWKGYKKCDFIRTYMDRPHLDATEILLVAQLLNNSKRPLILAGHGVTIAGAEAALGELAEKGDIPVATTLHGLSALPTEHSRNIGMVGMHGKLAANIATNRADVILAVGMRFDDRVIGNVKDYAPDAKLIHIDIDASEIGRSLTPYLTVHADAKDALVALLPLIKENQRPEWINFFSKCEEIEWEKIIKPLVEAGEEAPMNMAQVVTRVSLKSKADSILVTDVGQNQMSAVRYFKQNAPRSVITSGGLGTMGFGMPAAIGAKFGCPERPVCMFCGDGGFQMTEQELGTIMQYQLPIKIVILNNNFLGNVRQWQKMFFNGRYSHTRMVNPDFVALGVAYGIQGENVENAKELDGAIDRMFATDKAYILNVNIDPEDMLFPMICPGDPIDKIMLSETEFLDLNLLNL